MKVVIGPPPLFAEIVQAFPASSEPGTMFCFGERIYTLQQMIIPPWLIAHEQVHCDRQGRDIEAWWRRYLVDRDFRLQEELPAHVAEMRALCAHNAPRWVSKRAMRRHFAGHVAKRLSSPLYGPMIGFEEAKRRVFDMAQEA